MKYVFTFLIVTCLVQQTLGQQTSHNGVVSTKVNLYEQRYQELADTDLERAKLYLDSLQLISKTLDNPKFRAQSYKALGHYHYLKSEFQQSVAYCNKAIHLFDSLGISPPIPNILNQLGISQKYLGDYDEALKSHQKSADLNLQINGEPLDLARSYLNMGNVMAEIRNFDTSTEYYLQAEEVSLKENLQDFIGKVWGNLAANYNDTKNYEKALEYYFKGISYMEENQQFMELARQYNNIGVVYDNRNDFKAARAYYTKALKLTEKQGEPQLRGLVLRNLGEMYIVDGDYKNAQKYIAESITIAKKIDNKTRLIRGYMKMAEVQAALGNYQSAYAYDRKYALLNDSIRGVKVAEQINKLEITYQTEKKEAEIALQEKEIKTLNQEVEISNLKKGLYAGGMASALALSGLLVFGYQQRIKKNRMAREQQEAIYKQEIAHKKKELASQTLHLVQKNTFIQELRDNLENLKSSPEKFKLEFRRIVMLLKKQNASDKDWEVFKSYFSEVHNDFDQKLKTRYPDISEKEIRLAAFLRMNLTTKEIAATLNVLPESILKSKYRLKKKLGLDKETDLTTFLNTL